MTRVGTEAGNGELHRRVVEGLFKEDIKPGRAAADTNQAYRHRGPQPAGRRKAPTAGEPAASAALQGDRGARAYWSLPRLPARPGIRYVRRLEWTSTSLARAARAHAVCWAARCACASPL